MPTAKAGAKTQQRVEAAGYRCSDGVAQRTRPCAVRLGLGLLLSLAGVLSTVGCRPTDQSLLRSTRGYVVISIDTLRADHLSSYGYERPALAHVHLYGPLPE
jgi:hypothetical protein